MFTSRDGHDFEVVDVHQHMAGSFRGFDPDLRRVFERVESSLDVSLDELGRSAEAGVALLDSVGVDGAWVLAEEGPPSGFGADSLYVADYCHQVQGRLTPIGCVNPKFRTNIPDRVERLDETGIRGIKLYCSDHNFSPLHPGLEPVYDWLARTRRPLMVHTGAISRFSFANLEFGRPACLEPVVKDFPTMPVILVHCGKGPSGATTEAEALDMFETYDNVWLELSDLSPVAVARVCTEERAPRTLFGSDMPQFKPSQYRRMIQVVADLDISPEARAAVLAGNARRLVPVEPPSTDPSLRAGGPSIACTGA